MTSRIGMVVLLVVAVAPGRAEEPNETFFDATVLPAGVLAVTDALDFGSGSGAEPDTIVGSRGLFGDIVDYDDDGSPYGNGAASALYNQSTNSGSIDFAVTGYPDDFFGGGHSESGAYGVFVTVYDFFGDQVDSFTEVGYLDPGAVDEYSYSDFNWLNGSYDVEIDNVVLTGEGGDVDFFTFTGLTPGEAFSAEVFDTLVEDFDTILGRFDTSGQLVDFNDDKAEGVFTSLLSGTVPASGTLTFAVTGYDDFDFLGQHAYVGEYDLVLTLGVPGDFNGDRVVDAADYTVWRDSGGSPAEYQTWRSNYGATPAVAVPEPAAFLAMACATLPPLFARRAA